MAARRVLFQNSLCHLAEDATAVKVLCMYKKLLVTTAPGANERSIAYSTEVNEKITSELR